MKIRLFFMLLAAIGLTHSISFAQKAENQNPYAIFGIKPYVVGETKEKEQVKVFVIENLTEGSTVSRLEHDTKTGIVTSFDKEGNAIGIKQLKIGERAWPMQDPHARKYAPWSPYAYCANNPVNITDPTGMDWVRDTSGCAENGGLGRFVWMDDVISRDNTPNGYIYVGGSNNDLLAALNVLAKYSPETSNGGGLFMDNQGNANMVGIEVIENAIGRLWINPVVNHSRNNVSDNNQFGITFAGVNITGSYFGPLGPNNNLVGGKLTVYLGAEGALKSELLMRYDGPQVIPTGGVYYEGTVFIPAGALEISYLSTANISTGGYMTGMHIEYVTPSFSWHLQKSQTFRSGMVK